MATALPPPPTQPTSDSNETPLTTFQQPEEPTTVSPPTTNSPNDNNDESETESDSQVVSTTGVVSGVPSSSETATDGQISTNDANVGLIVGIVIAILVVMALILVLVAVHIASTKLKKHKKRMKELLTASFPTDTNQAYGVATPHEEITYEEENMYNYPEVVMNSAHASIATDINEAYATNIVPSENEAYIATNITTDKNLAYGSFSKSETEAESDYVYEFCQ